jgi:PadR family transcriptional regulator, regulatory protein PadR
MKLTPTLGRFEEMILTAVMVLEDDAYGMQIHSKVCELAGREMSLGSVYVTLDRLKKKGYVSCKVADGGPERGGMPRKFYSLRPPGMQALRESVETATRISQSFWSFPLWKPLFRKLFPKKIG